MTIQPISEASVALYLTPADLRERGVCPDALTAEHTLELARDAFRQAGLPLEGQLEIETYPDKCGVLVFVHLSCAPEMAWRFEEFDALLAAAAVLEESSLDAALYWWEDSCWLVLTGQDAHINARLSEFGTQEAEDPYILARLEEYGIPLVSSDAPAVLQRYFPMR